MVVYNFRKLTEINLTFMFALYLILPVLGPYIKSLGYTNTELGFIFALFPLAIILIMPIIGNLSDIIGKRNIIVMAMFLQIIAFVLYIYDIHLINILVARIFDATAFATLTIITLAKMEDGLEDKNRGQKGGLFLSISYLGKSVAPLVGGFLADYFFVTFPFYISIIILSLLLILLFDKKEIHFKKIHRRDLNLISDIKYFLSFKQLRIMGLLGMCAHAVHPLLMIFLPLYILSDLGQPHFVVGIALFLIGITHLMQSYFGRLCDKYGSCNVMNIGLSIYGIGLIGIFLTNSLVILLPVLFVMGMGCAMWNVSAWTLMSTIGVKQKREGVILATYTSIAKIGALFSYIASGIIVDMFSFHILALINGVIVVSASAFAYFKFDENKETDFCQTGKKSLVAFATQVS